MAKKHFDGKRDLIVEKGFFRDLDGGDVSRGRSNKKSTAKKPQRRNNSKDCATIS